MPKSERQDRGSESGSWLRTLYQHSRSDTIWAKEQGWRVVNWALVLFGANLSAQRYIISDIVSPVIFVLIDAGILLAAILYIVDLHCSANYSRRLAARIEEKIPEVTALLEPPGHGQNRFFYLGIQFAVIVTAFVLVVLAHYHVVAHVAV